MNPREQGFLLLSSHLGNPDRKPLTQHQLGILAQRVRYMEKPEGDRPLQPKDLWALGYSHTMAERIVALLEEEDVLEHYCLRGKAAGCFPITRISGYYPTLLHQRLGTEAPGCLWAKGDPTVLQMEAISLVGSRELLEENRRFAQAVGELAAASHLALVSGNARGADRAAQEACLAAGGKVISIVADALDVHPEREGLLYLSEDGFSESFSAARAFSRNRVIHALGRITFVAQSGLKKGGTWQGTVKNLRNGWSTVACFRDGSPASRELEQMGAYLIGIDDLKDFSEFPSFDRSLFDSVL